MKFIHARCKIQEYLDKRYPIIKKIQASSLPANKFSGKKTQQQFSPQFYELNLTRLFESKHFPTLLPSD